jgi:ubiquinone/menaquinone biosynthesis C-methylase UbiE
MLTLRQIMDLNQEERDHFIADIIEKFFPAEGTVLDVGSGTSPYRKLFSKFKYLAHDFGQYHGEKLGGTKEYSEIDIKSDISAIPLPDESVEAIICTEVLEHVPEPLKAFKEFSRLLVPKGLLVITAPLTSGEHQLPYHFYGGFSKGFYEFAAGSVNMAILHLQYHGGFLRLIAQELARLSMYPVHSDKVFLENTLTVLANNAITLDSKYCHTGFSIGVWCVLQKK